MKYRGVLGVSLTSLLCCAGPGAAAGAGARDQVTAALAAPPADAAARLATARVPFIANEGQIGNPGVRYYARTFAGTVFVTANDELVYTLPQQPSAARPRADGATPTWAFRERLGEAENAHPRGAAASRAQVSVFKGDDPRQWRSHLTTYDSLDLGEPYPGIRVALRAAGDNVEKIFHVAPGADAGAIDIAVAGAQHLSINAAKALVLGTGLGDVAFTAPVGYQLIDGERKPVRVTYALGAAHHYGFEVGPYERSRELVIDPLLASTYIGGHNPHPPGNYDDDIIYKVVPVGSDIYIAGATQSPDFPIVMGYDETLGGNFPDGFVTRMSGDLSTVIASTYIGTADSDRVQDIAVEASGSVIAVGQAGSGFPVTAGAYNWKGSTPTYGGFVTRFSADLSTLQASAMPNPSGGYPYKVALGNGGVYFGGSTDNPAFPITPGAYESTCCALGPFGIRDYDAYMGKLSADLGTLQAMTYLGDNNVTGIAIGPDGTVFYTDGSDYAIDGHIASLTPGLTDLTGYLHYDSNSGYTRTYFNTLAVGNGEIVTAGQTYVDDLPATPGAFDTTCGTDGLCDGTGPLVVPKADGFVAILSYDLQETLALTYLGGSDFESIRALTRDPKGDIYVTGETTSVDFPTGGDGADTRCGTDGQCNPTGQQFPAPASDGFVARLSPDLAELKYGTYLGGSGQDQSYSVAVDASGYVYAAGYTDSADFPTTTGAFDRSYNGGTSDAFISRIDAAPGTGANLPPVAEAGAPQTAAPRQTVTLDGSASSDADGEIVQYAWRQVFGQAVTLQHTDAAVASFRAPFVPRGTAVVLVFQLDVTDDDGAGAGDRVRVLVHR